MADFFVPDAGGCFEGWGLLFAWLGFVFCLAEVFVLFVWFFFDFSLIFVWFFFVAWLGYLSCLLDSVFFFLFRLSEKERSKNKDTGQSNWIKNPPVKQKRPNSRARRSNRGLAFPSGPTFLRGVSGWMLRHSRFLTLPVRKYLYANCAKAGHPPKTDRMRATGFYWLNKIIIQKWR